jgi:hypothetical protein
VIFEHGPFTREEVKSLDEQQLADYFYVTSWILRQEGEAVFKAERETMRGMFLRRLQRGERLKPAE